MNYKSFFCFFLTAVLSWHCFADSLEAKDLERVNHFIAAFKSQDINRIASVIQFPVEVDPLLPSINNKEALTQRFAELFDQSLLDRIVHSNPQHDWARVGWRGIMYGNGEVWLNDEGKLSGTNYLTSTAKTLRADVIREQRNTIYPRLSDFIEPILQWETQSYRVRIDRMGEQQFRLALWPVAQTISQPPQMVLDNGSMEWQGTGGNHTYRFSDGKVTYRVEVTVLGEEAGNRLVKLRGEDEVFSEPMIKESW